MGRDDATLVCSSRAGLVLSVCTRHKSYHVVYILVYTQASFNYGTESTCIRRGVRNEGAFGEIK